MTDAARRRSRRSAKKTYRENLASAVDLLGGKFRVIGHPCCTPREASPSGSDVFDTLKSHNLSDGLLRSRTTKLFTP